MSREAALLGFTNLLSWLLSYYTVSTKLEVKANEKGKDNDVAEELTSEQRTEINILTMEALPSTYPAAAVGEAHINQTPKRYLFASWTICLLTIKVEFMWLLRRVFLNGQGLQPRATLWIGCNKTLVIKQYGSCAPGPSIKGKYDELSSLILME